MLTSYTVVDLRPNDVGIAPEVVTDAHSPEDAATRALGLDLVRSGRMADLQAKVYFQYPDKPLNLVRLYARTADGNRRARI